MPVECTAWRLLAGRERGCGLAKAATRASRAIVLSPIYHSARLKN
jgi:hypothetical protein